MTAVALCGSTALPCEDVAEKETHTPHRNVRVDADIWNPFGQIAGQRARSTWIIEFIEAVVRDPDLWRDIRAIAAARNEHVADVVNRALRSYVARNRHVLDAASADQQE